MRTLKITGILLASLLLSITLILLDLHRIEKQSKWSSFQRFRVRAYLQTCFTASYLVPPIGSLKLIPGIITLTKSFVNKQLPDISAMEFYRKMLMNPSFTKEVQKFERSSIRLHQHTGQIRFVKEIKQRVYFGQYQNSIYDDWMVLMCTEIIEGKPRTSYLVWGMGVTTDPKAYQFFGAQSRIIGTIVPMQWINQLEREGLAKGYWCLLTESNATSRFSYDARYLQPAVRKQMWLKSIKP